MKDKEIKKPTGKWYQRAWYFTKRIPGHIALLIDSRAFSIITVGVALGAGVVTGAAVIPLAIGISLMTLKTGVKVYDVMKARALQKEANLITELTTRLYHQQKILDLEPNLSPLKDSLSKVQLNNDPNKKPITSATSRAVNIFNNSVNILSKGFNVYNIAVNPTEIKVLRQSLSLIQGVKEAKNLSENETLYKRVLNQLAESPEERRKLTNFVNDNMFSEGRYNYSNLKELQEQIQKIKNDNQALIGVIKDKDRSWSKLDEQGLKTKFQAQLDIAQKNPETITQETRLQSLWHGVKGAFNPYNPYINVVHTETGKDSILEPIPSRATQENPNNLNQYYASKKLATRRPSIDDADITLPSSIDAKEQVEQAMLVEKAVRVEKPTMLQKIGSSLSRTISSGVKLADRSIELIVPNVTPTEEVRHSGLTLGARKEKRKSTNTLDEKSSMHSGRDDFVDLPNSGQEEYRAKFEKDKKLYIEEQKMREGGSKEVLDDLIKTQGSAVELDINEANNCEIKRKEREFKKKIQRIGRAKKQTKAHKNWVTTVRQENTGAKDLDQSSNSAPGWQNRLKNTTPDRTKGTRGGG